MASYWGALPGVTDTFHVYGKVTGGSVDPDGRVKLVGTVTEIDYDRGDGKVFIALNEPFEIVTGGSVGENAFTLEYCLLPVWHIAVMSGGLRIQ